MERDDFVLVPLTFDFFALFYPTQDAPGEAAGRWFTVQAQLDKQMMWNMTEKASRRLQDQFEFEDFMINLNCSCNEN